MLAVVDAGRGLPSRSVGAPDGAAAKGDDTPALVGEQRGFGPSQAAGLQRVAMPPMIGRGEQRSDALSEPDGGAVHAFPILRRPTPHWPVPVLVSIPHYGTRRIPGIDDDDFAEPGFRRFPQGYADAFAAELYGDLHRAGATVLATPFSRLFVDLNRRRTDYDVVAGSVRSRRGVVRTHIAGDRPIFARPVTRARLERRLAAYYDPYHRALDRLAGEMLQRFGGGLVLDAHTGSEKGMGRHQVIIGTRRGETAGSRVRDVVADVFAEHRFEVHHDVPGYAGAHIVRRIGRRSCPSLHAIQVEVNSALLMTGTRREHFARIDRGDSPAPDDGALSRLRGCLREVVRRAGEAVRELG